jgi:hypothetical protein
MPESERQRVARDAYEAFERRDRAAVEAILGDDFVFFSGSHPGGLDRGGFFEKVWPNVDGQTRYRLTRLEDLPGDEILVTYESTGPDASRYRGAEIFSFSGGRMSRAEAYSGW